MPTTVDTSPTVRNLESAQRKLNDTADRLSGLAEQQKADAKIEMENVETGLSSAGTRIKDGFSDLAIGTRDALAATAEALPAIKMDVKGIGWDVVGVEDKIAQGGVHIYEGINHVRENVDVNLGSKFIRDANRAAKNAGRPERYKIVKEMGEPTEKESTKLGIEAEVAFNKAAQSFKTANGLWQVWDQSIETALSEAGASGPEFRAAAQDVVEASKGLAAAAEDTGCIAANEMGVFGLHVASEGTRLAESGVVGADKLVALGARAAQLTAKVIGTTEDKVDDAARNAIAQMKDELNKAKDGLKDMVGDAAEAMREALAKLAEELNELSAKYPPQNN